MATGHDAFAPPPPQMAPNVGLSLPFSTPQPPHRATGWSTYHETPPSSSNPFVETTWSKADAMFRDARKSSTLPNRGHHVTFEDNLLEAGYCPTSNIGAASDTPVNCSFYRGSPSGNPFLCHKPLMSFTEMPFKSKPTSRTSQSLEPPPIPERKSVIKVDKFDGSGCVETFLLKFEHVARYNRWTDRDKAAHLGAALTGSAGLILWGLDDPSYEELVSRLSRRYGSKEQHEKFRHELRSRRRKKDEGLQELAQDIERLAALAYPSDPQVTRDRLGTDAFIESLMDPELICKIREKEPESPECAEHCDEVRDFTSSA
jgi:hypothetical protein